MRLLVVLSSLLLACTPAAAQYFDEGWKPGMPVRDQPPAQQQYQGQQPFASPPKAAPTQAKSKTPLELYNQVADKLTVENVLGSGPAVALFDKFGINITDKLANATKNLDVWDKRIPLITDENYEDIIVNEEMTEEEARDRVWLLIITVTAAQPNGISQFADQHFDDAFNQTLIAGDLPNVRWGRIDYINVTYITTKWGIWNAPNVVVLKDRGQTLRFYRPNQIRLRAEALREFLKNELWQHTPPWNSAFAPGGKREFVMHWIAVGFNEMYRITRTLPRWLLYIITGAIGSIVIQFLHRGETKKLEEKAARKAEAELRAKELAEKKAEEDKKAEEQKAGASSATASPKKGKKKGGKK
ncbi:unnamed protein product [Peniophora sp. CBMAI 1063]|nr:unnamed protein product [Peniophora sp. CBMAI 1063]